MALPPPDRAPKKKPRRRGGAQNFGYQPGQKIPNVGATPSSVTPYKIEGKNNYYAVPNYTSPRRKRPRKVKNPSEFTERMA